jgi:hypothetical protein
MSKKKSKPLKKRKKRSTKHLKRVNGPTEETRKNDRTLDAKLRERSKAMGMDPDNPRTIENPDEPKMSAVILALADAHIKQFWGDERRVRGIITCAVTAWNMTFLPEGDRTAFEEKLIEETLPKDADAHDITALISLFDEFQEKQKTLFPQVRKIIMAHDLRMDEHNLHLDISSIPLDT